MSSKENITQGVILSNMVVINLFGGPGTGKSTTAAGLFYEMKSRGYKVELVTEFAKDLVYQESYFRLKDQLMILARQNHKLWVLKDKVDYAIVDSPLLLSQHYYQDNGDYSEQLFKDFVLDTYNRYNNFNIFLQRNIDEHPYQQYGRSQTLDEAIEIDNSIKKILQDTNSEYKTIDVSKYAVELILRRIDDFKLN